MTENAGHPQNVEPPAPCDADTVHGTLLWLAKGLYAGMQVEITAINNALDAADADPTDADDADPTDAQDHVTVAEAHAALRVCTALQNGAEKIIEWLQQDKISGPDRAAEGAAALLRATTQDTMQRGFWDGMPSEKAAPHLARSISIVITTLITISCKPWAISERKAAEARAWAEISGYRPPQERVQSNHLVMQYLPTLPLAEPGSELKPTPIIARSKGYTLPVLLRADVGQRLPKHLTVFDRHVFNGACTLWAAGCRTFTLPQIYRVMHGRTDPDSSGDNESREATDSILESLKKLQCTQITIDYTHELAALSPRTRRTLGDLLQRRECHLLPISIDTMQTPTGIEYTAVRLNSEPALLTDALARHQILRIPSDVIDVHRPDGKRPRATALFHDVKEVLIARVTVLRRLAVTGAARKNGKGKATAAAPPPQVIRAEYLNDQLAAAGHAVNDGTPAARQLRTKAREAARTVLQHMQAKGWISGYKEVMRGKILQNWTITFSPNLPQLPDSIPDLDTRPDGVSE